MPNTAELLEAPRSTLRDWKIPVPHETSSIPFYVILGIGFIFLCRLFIEIHVPIIGDEAYYWLWSKHLALGYHDHPPLIGWIIALTTFFSNAPFFVRLPALLCSLVSAWVFYRFSLDVLGDSTKAGWSLLFYLYIPILTIFSNAIFPDTLLMLGWVVCLWAGWKSLRNGRYWLLTGTAVGFALLSKLTGFFLGVSFLLFFAINADARIWLRNKIFWQGVMLAFLVSLPLWVWNIRHGGENFFFQIHDHLKIHPSSPWLSFLGYWGVQSLNVSPLLFVFFFLAAALLIKKSFEQDAASQFLLCFALPIQIFCSLLAFRANVGYHWAVLGYLPLVVAVQNLPSWEKWRLPAFVISAGMTLTFFFVIAYPTVIASWISPLDALHPQWGIKSFLKGKGYGEIIGYRKFSQAVENQMREMDGAVHPFLLTDSYTLSSDLAYYTHRNVRTLLLSGQGAEYARWDHFQALKGQNAFCVSLTPFNTLPEERGILSNAFESVGPTEIITTQDGPVVRTYYSKMLYNLRKPELLTLNPR